jgi:hypothetical protein
MLRFITITFLIAHAAIHLAIWATPAASARDAPFDPSRSWLLGPRPSLALGVALIASALLAAAGVGLWMHEAWWRPVAVGGLGVSLSLMIVWFNPWFTFIEVVNAGLAVAIAFFSWPTRAAVGA